MLHYDNGGRLIEDPSELPALPESVGELYLDFETTSGDPKKDSLNPWHHCDAAGAGVTWDALPGAFYVPATPWGRRWVDDLVGRSRSWVNHNVKYDAHVHANYVGSLPESLELVDTVVQAKIVDSDRGFKGGYGLDALSTAFLGEDIRRYEEALQPYLFRNRDYGAVPADVMAEYACQDVITNRRLKKYLDARLPEESGGVWDTERYLTRVLFEAERHGMRVDPQELKIAEFRAMYRMAQISEELKRLVGRDFRPHVNEDCYEVLCLQYGLPVLALTNADDDSEDAVHNPSFDKHALVAYSVHPQAPEGVVPLIQEYRQLNNSVTLFLRPYQELNVDGVLHPSHNQVVRTGRMSCVAPNSQQLDKKTKALIHPGPGRAFMSADYSQIEFRWMMHYIQDEAAIAAYHADPDTDFHKWVAEQVGTQRKPAKTINFMIGFGAGKKKTIKNLSSNKEVVGDAMEKVKSVPESQRQRAFEAECERRGLAVYEKYHDTFPGIKRTSRKAGLVCKDRGFVRNAFGRRRYLPATAAHLAFNTVNQGSAADLMKNRMVAVHRAIRAARAPIDFVTVVHDELLSEGPIEVMEDPQTKIDVAAIMEECPVPMRVPIRVGIGTSRTSWREACSDEASSPVVYDRSQARSFGRE